MLQEFPMAIRTGILIPPITASREPAHHRMQIGTWFRAVPILRAGITRNQVAHHKEQAATILRSAVQAEAAAPTAVPVVQVAAVALTAVRVVPPEAVVPQ